MNRLWLCALVLGMAGTISAEEKKPEREKKPIRNRSSRSRTRTAMAF